ncbi:MAG TPA: hypothetical protein VF695_02580 [Sphingomonas sp.]|jgi:hypothetical protein
MSNSDADWENWEQIDSYYAVVSHVEYRGATLLHFNVWRADPPVKTVAYSARRHLPGVQPLVNVARGGGEPLMQMNEYPLEQIVPMADRRGFGDVLVDVGRHGNVLTATIAARRSAARG